MGGDGGGFQRRLGLPSAIAITVGGVIGSGIFLKPLKIAQALPAEWSVHALWIGLGLVCLCGAFAYAELGAMFPEAGGQYAFLREAWGRWPAFLFGWVFFWAINAGTLAALATAFAKYVLPWCGIDDPAAKDGWPGVAAAAAMILVLAAVNHFGVRVGALVQNVSTAAKAGALALIAAAGVFVVGGGSAQAVPPPRPDVATAFGLEGLVTAFLGIFWAYEGWYQLPFNAAELRAPERNLPRGLVLGMLALIAIYVAVNATYLHVVPFAEIRAMEPDERAVARLTIERLFGAGPAAGLTMLVALSVFGAANPNFLSSTRAFQAMAADGMLPPALVRLHPRWGTPTVAIWVQAVWAVLLIVWFQLSWALGFAKERGFHAISDFVVFAAFLFYGLTVAGVYRLRRTQPARPRPYRCTGYPFTPAVFVLVALLFVGALLIVPDERDNAWKGLWILVSGVPAWFLFGRRGRRRAVRDPGTDFG